MQNKALVIVAVILGIIALALVTTVVYNTYAKDQEPDPVPALVADVDTANVPPPIQLRPEVRAKQAISRGTKITTDMVEMKQVESPATDAVTTLARLENTYATVNFTEGQVILAGKLHDGPWKVLVAATAIAAGMRADIPNNITTSEMPELPDGAIEVGESAKILGRICRKAVRPGDVINEDDFYPQGAQLSYLIPVYKRAITIKISTQDLANSYLIKQGDAVDVIARFEAGFAGVDVTRTIVQAAEVLALEGQMNKPVGDTIVAFSFVTLAVTPREAEKLAFANKHAAEIRLISRSQRLPAGQRETENAVRGDILGEGFGQTREVEVYIGGTRQSSQTIQEY